MAWILMLIGLVIGAATAEFGGALAGAVLGFGLGRIVLMHDRIKALIADQLLLREELKELRARLDERGGQVGTEDREVQSATLAPVEPREPKRSVDAPETPTTEIQLELEDEAPTVETAPAVESPRAMSQPMASAVPPSSVSKPPMSPLAGRLYRFLTEGNVVAKIGVIVLFFGLAFLLKYAADKELFPIGARLTLVGIGALVLLVIGWLLRRRHTGYALVLQGGGVGLLYLTLYAAMRLYGLLPASLTFGLMLLVVAGAAVLAILQDARSLAALGIIGGFLAPILAGSETGRHEELFSYYLLLDLGIVAIAWRKAWRELNLLAFLFTFVIGTVWGVLRYKPELFASTEPFLIGFFLIFLVTANLFARTQRAEGQHDYVQSSMVFGPPLIGFGLQAMLVRDFEYGLAWSALGLGLLYLVVFAGILRFSQARYQLLRDAFLVLGVGFVSLAVPFAFDGQWTSITWALEGAAMVWVGLAQDRRIFGVRLPVWFGVFLQFAAGLAYLENPPSATGWALTSGAYSSAALVGIAGLVCAYLLRSFRGATLLLFWGLLWWFGSGFAELSRVEAVLQSTGLSMLYVTASFLVASVVRLKLRDWFAFEYVPIAQAGFLVLLGGLSLGLVGHPFADGGFLAWPLALVLLYGLLWWYERRGDVIAAANWAHVLGYWMLVLLGTQQLIWMFYQYVAGLNLDFSLDSVLLQSWISLAPGAWWAMIAGLVPALFLGWAMHARHWPFEGHVSAENPVAFEQRIRAYRHTAGFGLTMYLLVWVAIVHFSWQFTPFAEYWASPLRAGPGYLPLLNGLDLVTLGVLSLMLYHWRRGLPESSPGWQRQGLWWIGAMAFLWLNVMIARSLHVFAALPLDRRLFDSALAQATYSIVWSVLGLILILLASRGGQRRLWWVAAGLLGVVVVKLFLIDLSGTNTLARIVSFVGVGLLLLLAGYVAPIPPKDESEPDAEEAGDQ